MRYADVEEGKLMVELAGGAQVGRMGIRTKLLGGFLFLSLLTAAAGGSGLFFVNRIGGTVERLEQVARPQEIGALRLQADMAAMENAMDDGIQLEDRAGIETAIASLETIGASAMRESERIAILAAEGSVTIDVPGLISTERDYQGIAFEALRAHREQIDARVQVDTRFAEFEMLRGSLVKALSSLAAGAEAQMSEHEDRGKTLIQ
jgi:hypothetical protein